MKKISIIFTTLLLLVLTSNTYAQEHQTVIGKVLSSLNKPVAGAIISATGSESVITEADGTFRINLSDETNQLTIWADGYYPVTELITERSEIVTVMIPSDFYKYNETAILPFRKEEAGFPLTSMENITKKDFQLGSMKVDRALAGQIAGLKMTRNGGMPGEGSYANLRGIRSFVGENAPLIVINGIPFIADTRESRLLNGYSRDILQMYNINDIQNITILKGAEASIYGSLGSNGVIMIETDGATSDDLETKISFHGLYGVNWNDKRMPLLEGNEYKSYLSDVGMTYFRNMEDFFYHFPFMNDPNSKYNYLYNHTTDWQNNIYQNGFVTDNLFRVEGGDEIAKYDLSLGYALENGIMDFNKTDRYHTQLNTNMLISKQFELFATVGLSVMNGNYLDQGMSAESNPVLAAYHRAPLLSPYNSDIDGNTLSTYSSYYYGKSTNMDFATSNPLAIINTVDGRNRQFDVNIRTGLTYKPITELAITGVFGLYYNFNKEHLFIPGLTNKSIIPITDQFGDSQNTVKEGVGEAYNMFYNLNANYRKQFDGIHTVNTFAGVQIMTTQNEYDAGAGRNTPNDFYQTLGSTQSIGRYFFGYNEKWNWMNIYSHIDYTYKNLVAASLNMAVDGASSAGSYGNHLFVYPSAGLTWLGKGWLPLSNSTLVNQLNLRVEYGLTGNSRYSSNYGKYRYSSSPYQSISGIVRTNIPNTYLKPEKNRQLNIGLDLSMLLNRVNMKLDYYRNISTDVIFAAPVSSLYGTSGFYDNLGEIENSGLEFILQASPIHTNNFEWIVGGNIAMNNGKIKSLGQYNQLINKFSDGAQLISKVGESPYHYYGFESLGVFATQTEADNANLINQKGHKFSAGDIHFADQNKDGRIDDKDRVSLGSSASDFFGGFYTKLNYKSFSFSAEFTYTMGNKAYNAVRRNLESLSTVGNQSIATANRWNLEGQVTEIPRAQWGDPLGNSDFSSRWIEDASYIRMKNVTLSYSFDRKILNIIRSGMIFITGENLFTATDYLGMDPEFSYSYSDAVQGFDYAKVMIPKSVKVGVNINF
jgi:TonB-linked SusC/RagA family outer membrane protein